MAERRSKEMAKERFEQRLRDRQERTEKGGGGGGNYNTLFRDLPELKGKFWIPVAEDNQKNITGKHYIDIVPYYAGRNDPNVKEGEEAYVLEFFVHRNVGKGQQGDIMCLQATYGKPCPICEDRLKRIRDGEDEKLLRALRPLQNARCLYNIICCDSPEEEKKGVQIFHTSSYMMENYLTEMATASDGRPGKEGIEPIISFMHAEEGRTVFFKREGAREKTRFLLHKFIDRDYDISQQDLDEAFVLDEIISIPEYDEVAEYYFGRDGAHEDRAEEGRSRNRVQEDDDVHIDDDSSSTASPTRGFSDEESECPEGHVFGEDIDKFPKDCESCLKWRACARESRELVSEKEKEKPEKSRTSHRSEVKEPTPALESPRKRRRE